MPPFGLTSSSRGLISQCHVTDACNCFRNIVCDPTISKPSSVSSGASKRESIVAEHPRRVSKSVVFVLSETTVSLVATSGTIPEDDPTILQFRAALEIPLYSAYFVCIAAIKSNFPREPICLVVPRCTVFPPRRICSRLRVMNLPFFSARSKARKKRGKSGFEFRESDDKQRR